MMSYQVSIQRVIVLCEVVTQRPQAGLCCILPLVVPFPSGGFRLQGYFTLPNQKTQSVHKPLTRYCRQKSLTLLTYRNLFLFPLAQSLSLGGDNSLAIQSILLSSPLQDTHVYYQSIKTFIISGLIVLLHQMGLITLLQGDYWIVMAAVTIWVGYLRPHTTEAICARAQHCDAPFPDGDTQLSQVIFKLACKWHSPRVIAKAVMQSCPLWQLFCTALRLSIPNVLAGFYYDCCCPQQ